MNILSVEGTGIKRKAQLYRKEYSDHKFEIFPRSFIGPIQLKEEKTWLKEVDHNLSLRINQIISTDDTSLFVQTIEEIEKVKSHYGFIEIEIGHIRVTWKWLEDMKQKVASFTWPSDDVYQEWIDNYTGQKEDAQE